MHSIGGEKSTTTQKDQEKRQDFSRFLYQVFQKVHPGVTISTSAISNMNSLINDMCERIWFEACQLTRINRTSTIGLEEIQSAVRLVFQKVLAEKAMRMGQTKLRMLTGPH